MAVVFTLAATGASVGCGGESEEDRVRAAIADAQEAFAAGQLERLCGMLSSGARKHIGVIGHEYPGEVTPTPCLDDVPVVYEGIRETSRAWRDEVDREVESVSVEGDRATAVVSFGEGATGEVPLVREAGEWRIDALYGGMSGALQEDHF